jgi:hypothetical protein
VIVEPSWLGMRRTRAFLKPRHAGFSALVWRLEPREVATLATISRFTISTTVLFASFNIDS